MILFLFLIILINIIYNIYLDFIFIKVIFLFIKLYNDIFIVFVDFSFNLYISCE